MFTIQIKCKRLKSAIYDELNRVYDRLLPKKSKSIIGNFNTKVERKVVYSLITGNSSLHNESNGNENNLIMFAAAREMVLSSTSFRAKIFTK